jgi:malate dehydrogenase (oxaloacetate-decarboxylating)
MTPSELLTLHTHKKLDMQVCVDIDDTQDLAKRYTPAVALPCLEIQKDPSLAYDYTWKKHTVAIISDGTAVLGLGNIWGLASLPVMEGKSMLLRKFGQVNCIPIVLSTQDPEAIIQTVTNISGGFGAIILEDIAAPQCFHIEDTLKSMLDIPVFHDDQHGTAIVVLAGLLNALKITSRTLDTSKIVIAGAGAAGLAVASLLRKAWASHIIITDSKGAISRWRDGLNTYKEQFLDLNILNYQGDIHGALQWADVFIGLSGQEGMITAEHIWVMVQDPILFAVSNPNPEVLPDVALTAWAAVVATGRSDFPNQLNNLMVFPGLFRAILELRAKEISDELKLAVALRLAALIEQPAADRIVPSCVDAVTHDAVYEEVKQFFRR